MNKFITYNARSKLHNLLDHSDGMNAVKLTANPGGGFGITFLFSANEFGNIIVCNSPRILVDAFTMGLLKEASIDFDYQDEQFIIKRDIREFSANT